MFLIDNKKNMGTHTSPEQILTCVHSELLSEMTAEEYQIPNRTKMIIQIM